jgi:hypothetical protein
MRKKFLKKTSFTIIASQAVASAICVFIITIFTNGVKSTNIDIIKKSGEFATPTMISQAKAECINKAEKDLKKHEDWEREQFKDVRNMLTQIYTLMIKGDK